MQRMFCDICEREIALNAEEGAMFVDGYAIIKVEDTQAESWRFLDLCDACKDDFLKLLKKHKEDSSYGAPG